MHSPWLQLMHNGQCNSWWCLLLTKATGRATGSAKDWCTTSWATQIRISSIDNLTNSTSCCIDRLRWTSDCNLHGICALVDLNVGSKSPLQLLDSLSWLSNHSPDNALWTVNYSVDASRVLQARQDVRLRIKFALIPHVCRSLMPGHFEFSLISCAKNLVQTLRQLSLYASKLSKTIESNCAISACTLHENLITCLL